MSHSLPPIRSVEDLVRALDEGRRCKYLFFWGHQRSGGMLGAECLSQWYESPFESNGDRYLTAEHYMMAGKARLFGDAEQERAILECRHPGEAKKLGRKVRGFEQERWNAARFELVVTGNLAKFTQHESLGAFLLRTGERSSSRPARTIASGASASRRITMM